MNVHFAATSQNSLFGGPVGRSANKLIKGCSLSLSLSALCSPRHTAQPEAGKGQAKKKDARHKSQTGRALALARLLVA
jgi:hypothetical protein